MSEQLTILEGDALARLRELPDETFHCVVTSPPYWGLRDYGVEGQIGLEETPEAYLSRMVEVFREVRRVLRSDGVCWVNLGDSYAGGGPHHGENNTGKSGTNRGSATGVDRADVPNLKPKDLCGIPWRLALALQADGWVLRQEIVWSKPNPMPESVRDRCTKAHEQIFLFAKATWSGPKPGQFSAVSDSDARWLAMFVDTEGNICVKRSERGDTGRTQYGIQIAFANTSRALVEAGRNIIGVGSVHERVGKNAPMFYWQVAGQQARDLLHRIYPFLIIKRRQAALGIHIQDVLNTSGKKRPGGFRHPDHTRFLESAWARMKQLNHFGSPDLSDVPEPQYGGWTGCARYFYDAEAVGEVSSWADDNRRDSGRLTYNGKRQGALGQGQEAFVAITQTRNRRSVWTIATEPYPQAHFATFPTELPKLCILAGTSARGCCPKCGKPWERVVERSGGTIGKGDWRGQCGEALTKGMCGRGTMPAATNPGMNFETYKRTTTGWSPTCECSGSFSDQEETDEDGKVRRWRQYDGGADNPLPCRVLDPFGGSGTTGQVALELGRHATLIELNPAYVKLAWKRCHVTPGLQLA